MKNNIYLYDTYDVPTIPKEIANERIRLLNNNLNNLIDVHYKKRDNKRIHDVSEAIKFWKKLRDGNE